MQQPTGATRATTQRCDKNDTSVEQQPLSKATTGSRTTKPKQQRTMKSNKCNNSESSRCKNGRRLPSNNGANQKELRNNPSQWTISADEKGRPQKESEEQITPTKKAGFPNLTAENTTGVALTISTSRGAADGEALEGATPGGPTNEGATGGATVKGGSAGILEANKEKPTIKSDEAGFTTKTTEDPITLERRQDQRLPCGGVWTNEDGGNRHKRGRKAGKYRNRTYVEVTTSRQGHPPKQKPPMEKKKEPQAGTQKHQEAQQQEQRVLYSSPTLYNHQRGATSITAII